MPCLNCGKNKTIKAHLIPRAFTMEVKNHSGEQHIFANRKSSKMNVTNTGLFDANILCGECDGHLGRNEGYAFSLFKKLRSTQAALHQIVPFEIDNGDNLVRFAAGIAWKYCVTKPEFGKVDIGPYERILAEVAFSSRAVPSSIDVTLIRLYHGNDDVYFYRAPLLDRHDGVNMVRFSVGGFLILLKTDRRAMQGPLPAECWLRGRTACGFLMAPAHLFEEWQFHVDLAQSPRISGFFQEMRNRRGQRD